MQKLSNQNAPFESLLYRLQYPIVISTSKTKEHVLKTVWVKDDDQFHLLVIVCTLYLICEIALCSFKQCEIID